MSLVTKIVKKSLKIRKRSKKASNKKSKSKNRIRRNRPLPKFYQDLRNSGASVRTTSETSEVTFTGSSGAFILFLLYALYKLVDIEFSKNSLKEVTLTSDIFTKLPDLSEAPKSSKSSSQIREFISESPSTFKPGVSNGEPVPIEGGYYKPVGDTLAMGARYNNPMNIRVSRDSKGNYRSSYWQGQTGYYISSRSGGFASFSDPYYSIRAAAKSIENYKTSSYHSKNLNRYGGGKLTLRSLIYIYAPPSENESENYVLSVSSSTGILPDEEISMKNRRQFIAIIKELAKRETNAHFSDEYLSMVFDAIWNDDTPPLQDILNSEAITPSYSSSITINSEFSHRNLQ